MTADNPILQQVVVRHSEAGYLRFDLPALLGSGPAAQLLRERLTGLSGVYRVDLYPNFNKLAVRFHPAVCDRRRVALTLRAAVEAAQDRDLLPGCARCAERLPPDAGPSAAPQAPGLKAKLLNLPPLRWVRDKLQQFRHTAGALQTLSANRFGMVPAVLQDPEKALHDFFNDILVLYLIKVHWERITTQWLRAPFRFRYQWLAAFYLTYLMVRARRQGH
jgi:hypothetical protein